MYAFDKPTCLIKNSTEVGDDGDNNEDDDDGDTDDHDDGDDWLCGDDILTCFIKQLGSPM